MGHDHATFLSPRQVQKREFYSSHAPAPRRIRHAGENYSSAPMLRMRGIGALFPLGGSAGNSARNKGPTKMALMPLFSGHPGKACRDISGNCIRSQSSTALRDSFMSTGNSNTSHTVSMAAEVNRPVGPPARDYKDKTMTATGNRGGGQRSKGDRIFVGTRLPRERRDLVVAIAKAEGITVSDLLAEMVDRDLQKRDCSNLDIQQPLPLGRMAS